MCQTNGKVKTTDGYRELERETPNLQFATLATEFLQDVRQAQNQIVLKTAPGHASSVAVALDDEEWPEIGCPRDSKGSCSLAIHAEQNAILYAVKNSTSVEGTTLYVTLSPCLSCSRIIYSTGIKRVIYLNSYAEYKGLTTDEGVDFLRKFGVECIRYNGTLSNVTQMN